MSYPPLPLLYRPDLCCLESSHRTDFKIQSVTVVAYQAPCGRLISLDLRNQSNLSRRLTGLSPQCFRTVLDLYLEFWSIRHYGHIGALSLCTISAAHRVEIWSAMLCSIPISTQSFVAILLGSSAISPDEIPMLMLMAWRWSHQASH